ncbi:hypothetical protein VTK26DRAFT_5611 [Humicola hyalothermophila]
MLRWEHGRSHSRSNGQWRCPPSTSFLLNNLRASEQVPGETTTKPYGAKLGGYFFIVHRVDLLASDCGVPGCRRFQMELGSEPEKEFPGLCAGSFFAWSSTTTSSPAE